MQLQFFISAFAFISTAVSAVALPSPSTGELGAPLVIREGGTSGCNAVPQCCQNTHSSKDKTVIQGLKIFGLDKDAEKARGGVATKCEPMEGLLDLNLLNGCKATAVCCNENKMNGLIFLGCIPITLNL
ncbi:hypothetical protein ACJ72_01905 [Emergomyces africanus]|uniref:Hydrophobin n=1 Tax=Emergomyces africanus TaxID=1955775 RepID=A0A1B7P3X3_9EURO|nr:hypothetical protein ACJ72_01905 [Emergomyces africanus]